MLWQWFPVNAALIWIEVFCFLRRCGGEQMQFLTTVHDPKPSVTCALATQQIVSLHAMRFRPDTLMTRLLSYDERVE